MIYTLTLNPSIDYIISLNSVELGKVNRCTKTFKFPGGKGINVSRVLKNSGTDSIALGFVGGFTGEFINLTLNNLGIHTDFIKVKEDSRINVKIKSVDETDINADGPYIEKESLNLLLDKLNELKDDDILVLAGKIQSSLPDNLYSEIQDIANKNNVKVVVDTSGKALLESVKKKPFLIKPNNFEIEEAFDIKIKDRNELIDYGKKLNTMGAENVIISLAEDGALLINNSGVFFGNAPKGEVKNSVGAGDSLVAGFLHEYSKSKNILDAFKRGIATGSASAFSLDLCDNNFVLELLPQIKLKKL
ncbi:1-phosphofructokinase [Clostridium thermobutyricum]|uniref:Tagatose-6-phosphate kinase n=1 Tax=Clostridium thermobutyricum DSM 4928 TaxID=1121339 RepID=A0A1V4SV60_9CLOT|nr:1-phosphofructokinase [Clostridium thermobutyricum]OPX47342.1 tagatose-6-phosphate kinase [Clostridium thermobutyricum DSM 4928]